MLVLHNIKYEYQLAHNTLSVFNSLNHQFAKGSFTSIQGPSGAGKTTFLNIIGLLDKPTQGSYRIEGKETDSMSDRQKSHMRAQVFGFLFQSYRLVPSISALDNVCLALEIAGFKSKSERQLRAMAALEHVGLSKRAKHLPPELSGGEAQRIAFARAIAKDPLVLLADEPTGNLDEQNRDMVLNLICGLHTEGKTVIMVTHDSVAAKRADINLILSSGTLQSTS